MSPFQKAQKRQIKLRMAIDGPSGAGKTYSSLALASSLGKRIAVIDSEKGSSALYADAFDFDVMNLDNKDPRTYTAAVQEAAREGYDVIIIDSLSHAWEGALQLKDDMAKRSKNPKDSFGPWRQVTPIFNQMIDAILDTGAHVICTLRAKTAYEISKDDRGSSKVEKLGLEPQFRAGVEYEFDIVADMDLENNWIVSKTRYAPLQGRVINRPGRTLAEELLAWLNEGEPQKSGGESPATRPTPSAERANNFTKGGDSARESLGVEDEHPRVGGGTNEPAPDAFSAQASVEKMRERIGWLDQTAKAQLRDQLKEAGLYLRDDISADNADRAWTIVQQAVNDYFDRARKHVNAKLTEIGIKGNTARHDFVFRACGNSGSTGSLTAAEVAKIVDAVEHHKQMQASGDAA